VPEQGKTLWTGGEQQESRLLYTVRSVSRCGGGNRGGMDVHARGCPQPPHPRGGGGWGGAAANQSLGCLAVEEA
jgi:hypothetical protein